MRRSPLFDVQKASGATFTTRGTWDVVAHYGAPELEYAAAHRSCALFDLSHRGKLLVGGTDRRRFLHGRLSNDIDNLPVGCGIYAAALDRLGRMLADMVVYALEESHLLELDSDAADRVGESFGEAIIAEDVEVRNVTEVWGLLSLQGPQSDEALALLGICAPEERRIVSSAVGGHPVLVAGRRRAAASGFDIFSVNGALVECWNSLAEGGARPAGIDTLNVLRVEAGIPWYGSDLDDSTIPLEANLEEAISYNKGCYVGQEIISRIHHLGRPARQLRGIVFEGDELPEPGDAVFANGTPIGRITSAVRSPAVGRPVALALLKRGHTEPGLAVRAETRGGSVTGRTSLLPFSDTVPV